MAKKEPTHINLDYFQDLTGAININEPQTAENLGKRIRQLRKERNISLGNLSEITGFTVSELEDIENGRKKLQLGTIMTLSKALDSALGKLVSGSGTQLYSITRKDQRKKVFRSSSGKDNKHLYSYMSLAPEVKGRHMEALIVQLERSPDVEISMHDGEEFIFVLDGVVELTIGDEVYDLDPGDSAYYLSTTSHFITAKSDKATILAVLYE